ncbi:two-component system response regulator ResD [Paenibacillus sp. JGP012]|uniref:response regulator transcription factor n=1 Tax=Paenibacillus sp. JGP012 TaxID=2735914 RepID=UPI0016071A29|nr:response regulator transcription factor [Paenibacillus sp. JGP012]MBB6023783.1 two-component system response regulator ResD [Paenibacillus sp. JGP012]
MNHVRKKILLVDDEARIRILLKKYFEKEGFIVDEAASGGQAIHCYNMNHGHYDLVILDWSLPDISGLEICRYMRFNNDSIPIVMLSGRTEEKDRIEGFKAGADDYISKPFSPREVLLRIQAIIGRVQGIRLNELIASSGNEILISEILIQPTSRRVMVQSNEVHLTPKEYDLLYFLVTNQEEAFSREELLREVWKSSRQQIYDQRTVDTHIKRLREKLFSNHADGNKFIQTLWGYGYRFCSHERLFS